MSKHDQEWIIKAAEVAVSGASGAADAAIGAVGGSVGALLTKTGLALAPGVAGGLAMLGIRAYNRHLAAKIDRWMDLVAIYMDRGSVEAAVVEIAENIDEEWAYAAVVEGVRAVLNDINSAALPFLARVTAYYLGAKRPIDRRGKRLCTMLSVCDEDVLNALRAVIAFCKTVQWDHPILEVNMLTEGQGKDRTLYLTAVDRTKKREEQEIGRVKANASSFEALHLMKEHQFSRDGSSGYIGRIAGPGVAMIDRESLDFLGPFLG